MRLGLSADHEGYELKEQIRSTLERRGFQIKDYGAFTLNPDDDYPDFVIPMASAVSLGEIDRGIAICGSGIGACIAANKIRKVRAGIIHDLFSARQGVEDDDMNVICIAARLIPFSQALELIECFLNARFSSNPKYSRRLEKISEIEDREIQK